MDVDRGNLRTQREATQQGGNQPGIAGRPEEGHARERSSAGRKRDDQDPHITLLAVGGPPQNEEKHKQEDDGCYFHETPGDCNLVGVAAVVVSAR